MRSRISVTIVLCAVFSAFAVSAVSGKPVFLKEVPNGGKSKCPTCHLAGLMPSKTTVNAFGKDFRSAGFRWTAELAKNDSDGDGISNGRELGDPAGTWKKGDVDPSGNITNQGDPASR